MKYRLSDIARIVGGQFTGADHTVTTVTTDSRNHCPADSLFVAIAGVNHDAHTFIPQLAARGVAAFLCQELPHPLPPNAGFVVVKDSLQALQALATHHRSQYPGTVVAITGSNGKTVVKEWIAQLWNPANGKLFRSPRSYNSQLGVPLSILMIEQDQPVAIIEAGISKPGEMERLQTIIRPDVVLFTNIGPAHGENFESQEQKLAQKELLFKEARQVIKAPADGTIETKNIALVEAFYHYMKLDHKPLAELEPVAMRLEIQEGILGSTIINDSYNSDIASLAIALDFAQHQTPRPYALILSDILQSSLPPDQIYAEVAALVLAHNIDVFVGIGANLTRYNYLFDNVKARFFYGSTEEYLEKIHKGIFRDTVVLIKGSRPFGFEHISTTLESRTHTTVMEVDLEAMATNLNHYRSLLPPPTRTMAMVKACGYGSGTVEVAAMLQHQGVHYLAVAFADEGVTLRQGGIHIPIVVLDSDPGSFAIMIKYSLEPEIYSFDSLTQYMREARRQGAPPLPIHIKLDTGMHRLGFMADEIDQLCTTLATQESLYVSTIFSHLAASEDPSEDPFTLSQIALFDSLSSTLLHSQQPLQNDKILRHICNTAAISRFPCAHYDMVRLGIGLYGGAPHTQVVSRLYTKIVQIKTLIAGQTIGYNRRGKAPTPTRIAILPIGYADGLSRTFGCGAASFNVGGILCPTIGNICMDTTILDITCAPNTKAGDRVEIFGHNPTIDDLATIRGTISYEILTSVSSRIRRIYITE